MRILFVDDAIDSRELFGLFFEIQGHRAHLACNGREAVAAVHEREVFDVIVMDVEMPQMDGWQAARAIRALERGQQVPLILFTAYEAQEDYEKAAQAGANILLRKPLLPDQLLWHIDYCLTCASHTQADAEPDS